MTRKQYIGNGIWVEVGAKPGEILLSTFDGSKYTNALYLERDTLENFLHYVDMTKIYGSSNESEG